MTGPSWVALYLLGAVVAFAVGVILGRREGRRMAPAEQAKEQARLIHHIADLAIQLRGADRIIARLTDLRVADANQRQADTDEPAERLTVVPPETWAALMEARDKPEAN